MTRNGSAGVHGHRALRAAQVVVAVVSAVVLTATGYGWSVARRVDAHLVTSDVLTRGRAADGATDILLVGLDSRTDAAGDPLPPQLLDALHAGPDEGTLDTDTLILVRVPNDPAAPTTAVSIPRDSYVAVPGFGTHKINSAYARGADAARTRLAAQGVSGAALEQQADQAGRRLLVTTVEQLTGASVDHYAEVNLAGFADVTQAVGGVPVCLNAPVADSWSGADFPAGPQTVQGAAALAFVRQRHGLPRGDLDRIVRQQAFLASLAHEVLSAGTLADPARLSGLVAATSRYVVVDPGWDLLAFAAQARVLTGGNIHFETVPTGRLALRTPYDGVAVQVDPAAVRAFVTALSGPGSGPPPAAVPATPPVTVDVRNATTRSGLAAGVMDLLDRDGFAPGRVGTVTPVIGSTVIAAPDDGPAAQQVAALLGGLRVHTDGTVPAGHVQVVLGRTYDGPAGSAAAPTPTPSTAAPDAPPAPPAITAAGVPCVN